jgi:hypothetical protein
MALGVRLIPETVRTLAFGSIGATYMGIGSAITNPIRIIHFQNLTDTRLIWSFDGINDHFYLPKNAFLLLDITANKSVETGFYLGANTRIYVKEDSTAASPTSGLVTVSAWYSYEVI